MNSRKVYWFRFPKNPQDIYIATFPFYDPRIKRLRIGVTDLGMWNLSGKMIKDTEEQVIFECDESMGAHGGRYELNLLTLQDFRKKIKDYVAQGDLIAQICKSTDDLHFWFRKNWPSPEYYEFCNWQMEENARKGVRTD